MKRAILDLASLAARWLPEPIKQGLYRLGPFTRLLRRALNRAAPHGLSETGVAAGGLTGARLLLDLQQEKDYWLGTYEPDLQAGLRERVQSGWIAYDVGANIGYMTLLLARLVGPAGRVFAFEALPSNVERLLINAGLNLEGEQISVIHAAVTAATAPVEFLVGPSDDTGKAAGSAGRALPPGSKLTVPGMSLDDFVYRDGNPAPQVLKMDIEGGEILALPGMRRLLTDAKPVVFLELHGEESAAAAWQEFTKAGYNLHRLGGSPDEIHALEELAWKEYLVASPR